MPKKKKKMAKVEPGKIVSVDFENRTYQVDTDRNKVYRRFVEIETSKASRVLSFLRETEVRA
jgi:hypothetical protein